MGIFCSVNDIGMRSVLNLPGMAAISENVVLWAPSGHKLKEWKRNDHRVPHTREIIELANAGHITLASRKSWLDPNQRASDRENNHRIPQFDAELEGGIINSDLLMSGKYLIVEGLSSFYAESALSVENRDIDFDRVYSFWNSPSRKLIPSSSMERIDNYAINNNLNETNYWKAAVTVLLRDARLQSELLAIMNCRYAFSESKKKSRTYNVCYPHRDYNSKYNACINNSAQVATHARSKEIDFFDIIFGLNSLRKTGIADTVHSLRDSKNRESIRYLRSFVERDLELLMLALEYEIMRARNLHRSIKRSVVQHYKKEINFVSDVLAIICIYVSIIDLLDENRLQELIKNLYNLALTGMGLASSFLTLYISFSDLIKKNTFPDFEQEKMGLLHSFSLIAGSTDRESLVNSLEKIKN